jgi:predicted XRE-type DNA-binding protein
LTQKQICAIFSTCKKNKNIKLTKEAKRIADDLHLSLAEAYIMELKSRLYTKSSTLIKSSKLKHEEIAKLIGTSRSRINRIANKGEHSISIELLIKIVAALEGTASIEVNV